MILQFDESTVAIIIFATIFFFGDNIRLPHKKLHRLVLSFAAGAAIAYIFVQLLPDLQLAKEILIQELASKSVILAEHFVYLAAMLGFIASYGLERMSTWIQRQQNSLFILQISGYAIYVWLISYLMVRNIETGAVSLAFYAIAMGLHFLALDFHLYDEYGQLYKKLGKNILTVAVVLGWGVGIFTELHKLLVMLLLGLISGAVIMNTMIMELPQGKDGKFLPFLAGGIFYTALLLSVR